jgi:predicted NAD/FAD-binding protein
MEERFHAAVIATAPWQASRLLVEIPETAPVRELIDGYRYEPICTINLRFDSRVEMPAPMLQLAGGPGQWVFDRTTPSMAGSQLAVVISADGPHRTQSHDALANAAVVQLRHELRATRLPALSWARVITERRATFACVPARAHPRSGAIANRVYLAGDHTDPDYPATLEAATRSGVRAATAVLAAG